jgi:multiple sugar transport system permease protein
MQKAKSNINTLIMLLPWIIVFAVFWLYPLLFTGYLSFNDYHTLTGDAAYIGLDNYKRMFSDNVFWKALGNTCFFTLGTVPITTIIALLLATLLNSSSAKFTNFFKATYFLPAMTSLVVIALIFTNLYAKTGYINTILQTLGMPFPKDGWLQNIHTSLPAIMLMDIWASCGYYMLIFLAAMQAIPKSLYESAKLAGASEVYSLIHITIPMLKPTFVFVLVINLIKSFQVFMEIYIMTKGGPLYSTTTLVYMIFSNGFEKMDAMGYASAISYFLFAFLLILSLIQLKIAKRT